MAVVGATVPAQAGSVCEPFETGFCGSMLLGPEGLVNGKAPGQPPRLDQAQRGELAQLVEEGPIPAVHGVVRWRLSDLVQWVMETYRTSISGQTLSRYLHAMGYRKLSARPRHHAQNREAVEDFKKRLQTAWQRSQLGMRRTSH
jgi:transposase